MGKKTALEMAKEAMENTPLQNKTKTELRIEDLEANVSTLTQMLSSLVSRIEDVEGNVSTVIQTSQGLQSQVSMLQDQVNLKVGKDEVISSINISNEGVRIKGDKIIFDKI